MHKIDKLFLIDGMALIYRSYYAMQRNPLTSKSGLNTSAIYGFVNTLLKIIKDENPTYIAVVLDTKAKTFRHDLYTEYKANRKPMPEDLSEQINPLYDILDSLNIATYKLDGFEADDILGTIAKGVDSQQIATYIYSSDKDLMQLVTENIYIYSPGNSFVKSKIYNDKEVYEKWGVSPKNIIDYLALVGDTSDNVPGVKGVGHKTASKLIYKYGNLEQIYNSIDTVDNEKLKNKLNDSKQNAYLSKKLVTLNTDVNIDYDTQNMLVHDLKFENIGEKLHQLDIYAFDKQIYKKRKDLSFDNNKKNYITIKSQEQFNHLFVDLNKHNKVSVDLETTNLDANLAEIVGISICFKANEAYYLPFKYPNNRNEIPEREKKEILKKIFQLNNTKYIGQNLKYDALVLKRYGIELTDIYFDTMIAESLISPEKNSYKLDLLSQDYLNYEMMPIENLIGDKKEQKCMSEVALSDIAFYACEDADIAFQIYTIQKNKIKDLKLNDLFYKVEIPLIKVLVNLEYNGVYIDVSIINKLSNRLKKDIESIKNKVFSISDKEFNLNSPKQLAEVLFDELQLKTFKKRSTSVEVLEKLKNHHPIIELILEYRHLSKLVNTYLDKMPSFVNEKTNRIHTSFNQVVASTGRLTSNKPNFQNIPIKTNTGKEIRKAFKAKDSNSKILAFDYSQIELRILAHYSKEKKLIQSFEKGIDVHSKTAALVYGISENEVETSHRRVAKIINYSIVYGAGPFRISQALKISIKEAANIIENYFNRYPGIKEYIDNTINFGIDNQYVETILGRRRNTINLNSKNRNVYEAEKRASINMPIQGSASELIKVAMININKIFEDKNIKSKMILQVHDELLFEVIEDEMDNVISIVKKEMEEAIKFNVPIKVDYNYGSSWFEAH